MSMTMSSGCGMRVGRNYAVSLAMFELALPFSLIFDHRLQTLIMTSFVLPFGGGKELFEQFLRANLAAGGVHGDRANNGLLHRNRDLASAFVDFDIAISLVENDRLQSLFVERRSLVFRALGPPFRVSGLARLEI